MVRVKEVELDAIENATQSLALNSIKSVPKNINSETPKPEGTFQKSIGILLSSYTRAINKQNGFSGSLFRQKTKAECLNCANGIAPSFFNTNSGALINIERPERHYQQVCFDYIHQNPVKAKLVENAQAWEYSSASEYVGIRNGTLVNTELAKEYVDTRINLLKTNNYPHD